METNNQNQSQDTPQTMELVGVDVPRTCYALRLFIYDSHEWVEVHAVSFDPKLLSAHFEGLDHIFADSPLVGFSEHITLAKREDIHWTIEPITFLHNAQGHPCRAADGIQIDGLSASDAPSCSACDDCGQPGEAIPPCDEMPDGGCLCKDCLSAHVEAATWRDPASGKL